MMSRPRDAHREGGERERTSTSMPSSPSSPVASSTETPTPGGGADISPAPRGDGVTRTFILHFFHGSPLRLVTTPSGAQNRSTAAMSAAAAFISPAIHVARASACAARPRRLRAPITRGAVASTSSSAPSSKNHLDLPTFPGGWLGPDLAADPSAWTHRLTDDEIAEIDAALASAEAAGLDVIDLTPDNFPLPSLASRLDDLRAELVHGRGLHLFKGVPVHRYTPWQRCAVFYGMGAHMGWTCPQNARGHVLGHVKDLGTFLFIYIIFCLRMGNVTDVFC